MQIIPFIFKAYRKLFWMTIGSFYTHIAKCQLFLNGVKSPIGLKVRGPIKLLVTRRGHISIGRNLRINSGNNFNIIGRQQKSTFWVEGNLTIGENVGMSSVAIICNHDICIGNNVIIGGNTVIYDTDFHSINPLIRNSLIDKSSAKWAPIVIKDCVFIGAHSTILKGITIGENSVIGACSVVTKDIPDNEIWAGNPAQFIKKLNVQ